jgi:hypothetical protein
VQLPYQQYPKDVLAFELGMFTVAEEVEAAATGKMVARMSARRNSSLDDFR